MAWEKEKIHPGTWLTRVVPEAAGALNFLLAGSGPLHAGQIDLDQTLNVSAWRGTDEMVRILAGNLEEGLRNDADMTRHTILVLPRSWKAASWSDAWSHASFESVHDQLKINLEQACSILLQPATH